LLELGCSTPAEHIDRTYPAQINGVVVLKAVDCPSPNSQATRASTVAASAASGIVVAVTPSDGGSILYQFPDHSLPRCFSQPSSIGRLLVSADSNVMALPLPGGTEDISFPDGVLRSYLTPALLSASFLRNVPATFSGMNPAALVTIDSPRQSQVVLRDIRGQWNLVTPSGITGCAVVPSDYSQYQVAYSAGSHRFALIKLCGGTLRALTSGDLLTWSVWDPLDTALTAALPSSHLQVLRVMMGSDGSVVIITFDTAGGSWQAAHFANSQLDVVSNLSVQGIVTGAGDQWVSVMHYSAGIQIELYKPSTNQWSTTGTLLQGECLDPKMAATSASDIIVVCTTHDPGGAYLRRTKIVRTEDLGQTWLAF
jgi:hypothetical protein